VTPNELKTSHMRGICDRLEVRVAIRKPRLPTPKSRGRVMRTGPW
jgi:hypothetical protein